MNHLVARDCAAAFLRQRRGQTGLGAEAAFSAKLGVLKLLRFIRARKRQFSAQEAPVVPFGFGPALGRAWSRGFVNQPRRALSLASGTGAVQSCLRFLAEFRFASTQTAPAADASAALRACPVVLALSLALKIRRQGAFDTQRAPSSLFSHGACFSAAQRFRASLPPSGRPGRSTHRICP